MKLNERELKVINKMFDAGINDFQGRMTAKKYMSITHISKATATRDLQHWAEAGALLAGGSNRANECFILRQCFNNPSTSTGEFPRYSLLPRH